MRDDIDGIMHVMEAAFDPQWGEAWNRRQLSDSLVLPHIHYTLVDSGGNYPDGCKSAAGFTLTKYVAQEEEILLIAVDPRHRGKGLARQLLNRCFTDAAQRGAERIFLEMRENNPARALYEALGFCPIGRRENYYTGKDGTRIDAITFAKKL
ncbi:GNAT family N-acetyltransferase [Pontixanthobacter sp.]|uniref:GNAT family N-acetyltransferase n=1 Tax=Pontixanthobacter sp. TaxID=2792078 RepID=UPI003C79ED26